MTLSMDKFVCLTVQRHRKVYIFLIFSAFSSTMWFELCQYRRNESRIWFNIYSRYFQTNFLCDIRLWIDESRLVMKNHISHLRKKGNWFSFSVHLNKPCNPSCTNIVEIIAESDSIFIPDISRYIFFVTLDYELMNPVLLLVELIEYTGSRPFKVSISHRHSERLYYQYLEKEREIVSEN
jgi:hypothetical protein